MTNNPLTHLRVVSGSILAGGVVLADDSSDGLHKVLNGIEYNHFPQSLFFVPHEHGHAVQKSQAGHDLVSPDVA
jgi:hypothetical protein